MAAYVAVIAGIVGIAGALGVAWAAFRTAADTKRRELDRDYIVALERANQSNEKELGRLAAKVDSLTTANLVLQETVSGSAAVKELADKIAKEESYRREEHMVHMTILKDILAQLKNQRGAIGR